MNPTNGLYDPAFEHDACGVAFVATMTGEPSHEIVQHALTALRNLEHRGASGSEPDSGDGAGILIQVPDALYRDLVEFDLPPAGRYAVGTAFLPVDSGEAQVAVKAIEAIAGEEGLTVLGWREVPTDDSMVGKTARSAMPTFAQIFVTGPAGRRRTAPGTPGVHPAQTCRARGRRRTSPSCAAARSSTRACSPPAQLEPFFPDLSDPRMASALGHGALPVLDQHLPALAAGPSLPAASRTTARSTPCKGNRNWMRAREALLTSDLIPGDLDRLFPICTPGGQ